MEGIIMNCIYEPVFEVEEPVFVYLRFVKGDEVGFSVTDTLTRRPDYSNCGVFYLSQKDFLQSFKPVVRY